MPDRYVAFDVETPNSNNDRMSAIGVSVIEYGVITEEYYSLVNPETHFDAFNIRLTGISEKLVSDKPTFPEVWQIIEPVMRKGVLAAHSAQFDLSVLAKCLRYYGIPWKPFAQYICTCNMAHKYIPGMENYKLNTLCDSLCIELDHHNAGSDCHACAELLIHCRREGVNLNTCIRSYDIAAAKTVREGNNNRRRYWR